jgi:hypothetical protein
MLSKPKTLSVETPDQRELRRLRQQLESTEFAPMKKLNGSPNSGGPSSSVH